MGKDIWRPVVGWEGAYEVSSSGSVRSLDRMKPRRWGGEIPHYGRILKPIEHRNGYRAVCLCFRGTQRIRLIHRVVAEAFLPRQRGAEYVNHKNGVKDDNRAGNLEWCTARENELHSTRVLGKRQLGKSVIGFAPGKPDLQFESATEAARHGFHQGHVSRVCRGLAKKHRGYYWKYA